MQTLPALAILATLAMFLIVIHLGFAVLLGATYWKWLGLV